MALTMENKPTCVSTETTIGCSSKKCISAESKISLDQSEEKREMSVSLRRSAQKVEGKMCDAAAILKGALLLCQNKPRQPGNEVRLKFEELINFGAKHPEKLDQNMHSLRQLVLLEGVPLETEV
jgi:hypothetical protein